jgi:hypothetical protein
LNEEKLLTQIIGAKKNTRFLKLDERTPQQIIRDTEKQNKEMFFEKYPDLEEEMIYDINQFKASHYLFENPDMNFCQLFISLGMFIFSIYAFYYYRDFNSEYYTR